jgi:hypothetical protein
MWWVGAAKMWLDPAGHLNCPLFGFSNLIPINVTMLRRFSELDLIIASFDVIAGGKIFKMDHGGAGLHRCLYCHCSLEIAAVKFSFFRHPAMILVCPNCGVTSADPPEQINVRDRVGVLLQKDRLVARHPPTPHEQKSPRGKSVAPLIKG